MDATVTLRRRLGQMLVETPAIRNLSPESKTYQLGTAMATGAALGMRTLYYWRADSPLDRDLSATTLFFVRRAYRGLRASVGGRRDAR